MRATVDDSNTVTTTDYLIDENSSLPQVLGAQQNGTTVAWYAYGPDGLVAQQVVSDTTRVSHYPLTDGLGSVRALVDAAGATVLERSYTAFGAPQAQTGSAASALGFTGEVQDEHTGLVYLRARWYDPHQGRFLQRDSYAGVPMRPQSLNRYAYTENNPVNWTDPSGRCVGWLWHDPTCQFIGRDRVLRGDLEWGEALDPLQVGLDVVGMVPGLELADGANGVISLVRGDRVGAALSFGSMVPFAGWGSTIAKWGRRGLGAGDAVRAVLVVGEDAHFTYARGLARKHPNWLIVGSRYGDGSNAQRLLNQADVLPPGEPLAANLFLLDNVDARQLHHGFYTRHWNHQAPFDVVVFNGPRTTVKSQTPGLIEDTLRSAHRVVRSGGQVRFNSRYPYWPGSDYLKHLSNQGFPGYAVHRRTPQRYQDPTSAWYVPEYIPTTSEGRSLGHSLPHMYWYIFTRQ